MSRLNTSTMSMNLFGLPYQFPHEVDPRFSAINENVGKRFTENILSEGPIATIIPGIPKYMPSSSKDSKNLMSKILLSQNGDFSSDIINSFKADGKGLKLYEFQKDYVHYMKIVNLLCNAGATFLKLHDKEVTLCGHTAKLGNYDWKNYKWLKKSSTEISNTEGTIENLFTNFNYVQFYVDADSLSFGEDMSNSTTESKLKGIFDTASDTLRDAKFMLQSGAIDASKFTNVTSGAADALDSVLASMGGTGKDNSLLGSVRRIINAGSNVLKGDNIVIPNIYQNSEYSKNYSLNLKLRTPYGTKLGYFLNIFVPLMHILALALPIQTSANTYESPFIVKMNVEGSFACNLGMVTNVTISRTHETRSIEGLPNEIEVSMQITDLYTDLALTDQDPFNAKAASLSFVSNSSLVDFLATNCGLSIVRPNVQKKWDMAVNGLESFVFNGPTNIKAQLSQDVFNLMNSFVDLGG